MIETLTYCVRGCSRKRRHLSDCEDAEVCRGCEPRRAEHGLLCWPCHRRFELMLVQAEIADRWLTANLPAGEQAARMKDDAESRHANREAPAPLSVAILDVRQDLRDRLACWADDLVEQRQLTGPKQHTVLDDSKFLHTWLSTVEHLEWIGDWFEELAETMSDAHALAPWRPTMTRVPTIPCPDCHNMTLAIFGGEEDVTCLDCGQMFDAGRYGIWERMLETGTMTA